MRHWRARGDHSRGQQRTPLGGESQGVRGEVVYRMIGTLMRSYTLRRNKRDARLVGGIIHSLYASSL